MSRLVAELGRACDALGIQFEERPFVVVSGIEVPGVLGHIMTGSPPKGMLVFSNSTSALAVAKLLTSNGYGYSVLSEPRENEEFSLEAYESVFRDWGAAS